MNSELERDLDRLYGLPLDQFVSARNALARTLKHAGDSAAASDVGALPKPSLVAWTVNQLTRRRLRDVELLLDAGKRIVAAQQASLSTGGRAELDAALTSFRNAIRALTGQAKVILGSRASAPMLARVSETLRSAAIDTAASELLARGRLVEEVDATGWELIAAIEPGQSRSGSSRRSEAAEEEASRRTALQRDRKKLEQRHRAADKRVQQALKAERAAEERLKDARAATTAAKDELAATENELGRAR